MRYPVVTLRALSVCIVIFMIMAVYYFVSIKVADLAKNAGAIHKATQLALAPMSDFQKGIVYASWWHGEYSSSISDTTISEDIKPMGVNWIAVVVTCYQEKIASTRIQCKPESSTPTDADLVHVIQYAHRQGLRVMLKPHVDLADDAGHWRGEIGAGMDQHAWKTWFESYTEFITHYATIARNTHADYFVVGTELVKTTSHAAQWRDVIKAVREIYSGPLTYASQHDAGEDNIDWWDALDAIGVDAYYTLAQNHKPTVAQIKTAWLPIVARLGRLSKKWERPIILTEVGYESLEGSNRTPWKTEGHTIAYQEQADSYQALFEAFEGKTWWHGVFWWVWTVNSPLDGALNDDFTASDKSAENILRDNYDAELRPESAAHVLSDLPKDQLPIYHGTLNANWENWSWKARVGAATPKNTLKNTQETNTPLKVSMNPWGAFSLHHPGTDTSAYSRLEFYIYVGRNTKQRLFVSFNDKSDHELKYRIKLPDSRYLEGGKFLTNKWQRVQIPFAELGVSNTIITRLNVKVSSRKYSRSFLIDEIRLVRAAPSPDEPFVY